MRRATTILALSALSSTFMVLPMVGAEAATSQPQPLTPSVRALPLTGVDKAALTQSPAPALEEMVQPGGGRVTATAALRPVAATGRLSTSPFSAVGVTWAPDPALETVAVQVRTRTGGRWGAWSEVEVQANSSPDEDASGSSARRVGSDPLYVGPSDGVQVRVDSASGRPRQLKVELIDPGTSPADASTAGRATTGTVRTAAAAPAAAPVAAKPAYVSRAGWGADERLRSCTPTVASTIKGGILHTTATGNSYTAAESPAIMRSMYAYHTQSLGWCDLGYNFVVDKYGTLFEGRFGGVDKAVVGAHTGGFNTATFGVSMMGNQDLVAPTAAMLTTVEKVFAWKLGLYGLSPRASATYTSAGGSATTYPRGALVTQSVISGHRDYSTKSCPGNYAYPLLPTLREAVAARMAAATTPPPPPAPVVKTATTLTLATSPSTLSHGAKTTLSGKLTTATGAPVAGKPVQVYVRKRGTSTYALLSTRTTAADGTYSGTHAPTTSVDYAVRFREDGAYTASGREARVDVAPAVTAAFSSGSVRLGGTVTFNGAVTPAHPGQQVMRQQLVNGTWTTLATATLSSSGGYTFTVKPTSRGTKTYRVVTSADSDHLTATSPTRTVVTR